MLTFEISDRFGKARRLRSGGFFRRDRSQSRRGMGDQVSSGLPEGLVFCGIHADGAHYAPQLGSMPACLDMSVEFFNLSEVLAEVAERFRA